MIGEFPVDLSVKANGRGPPPDGHPRRCQARNGRTHLQCPSWASRGAFYCRWHGGQQARAKAAKSALTESIYARNAGPQLRALLKHLGQDAQHERLGLSGEVDLARAVTLQSFQAWQLAITAGPRVDEGVKLSLADHLRRCVESVSNLALQAARVNALSDATVQVEAIDWVVTRVCKIVDEELRSRNPLVADRVVAAIQSIKLPPRSATGQLLDSDDGADKESFL